MVPVARRNLFSEKGRFAMSVGGVAFAVLLILIVVSLYRGWSAAGSVYTKLPGDVWIAQTGTSDPYHSTSLLASGKTAQLARVPGVVAVLPVYARHLAFPSRSGHALDAYMLAIQVPRDLRVSSESRRYLPRPGHIVIDRVLADDAGVTQGGRLTVLGRTFTVDRLMHGGNKLVQYAFVNAGDGRSLLGEPGHVSYYLLGTRPGTSPAAVGRAAAAVVPGSEAHTATDFARSFSRLVSSGFLSVVGVLVGIGFVVGGAVIALTTYTATLEKSRDFGVLKAIGASGSYLYRIVVWQSLLVGLSGSMLGIAVSAATARVIGSRVPEFVTDLRPSDVVAVFAAAVLMSILAAFVPVRRLNAIDPAMVFRA
jgi:putative ABC transport system permease protein